MRRLICCDYHEDSESVELRYTDGTLIDIDCPGVEDEVVRNSGERSELDWLLRHDPKGYADLVLNGCIRYYMGKVTAHRAKDERE
ncbi:MAG: DUF6061 family protein [Oscillospiraceae bacterium]|nr:DUF6061 family protein [Oscillospiraceae bacterium]